MKFRRATKERTGAFLNLLFVLGILILLQYLSYHHPHEWDMTQNKQFSLSPLSTQLLAGLKSPLELWIVSFPEDQQTRDLTHQYQIASSKVTTHFVDPRSEPAKARELGVTSPPPLVIVKYAKAQEQIAQPDEEKLTNAILRLTSGKTRTVYFLAGHGEPDPASANATGYSRLKDAMEGEGFTVRTLSLFKEAGIPNDASAVVEINPKYPPLPKEKNRLKAYVLSGGRLLFLCSMDMSKEWIDFLGSFGLRIGNNLVVDSAISVVGGGPEFLATNAFAPHPITDPFRQGGVPPPILLPLTRSVSAAASLPKNTNIVPLILTSPMGKAFSVKLVGQKIIPESKKPSQTGPIPVAEALESGKLGRIIVVGSSMFASNQWFSSSANKDFVLNAISWLSESLNSISIHPKSSLPSPFLLDRSGIIRLFLLSLVILPSFGIIAGIASWLRRIRG